MKTISVRLQFLGIVLIVLFTACQPNATPVATTLPPTITSVPPSATSALPTETLAPTIVPTPTLGIGATMTGEDGMTLVYIPAGEFMMGVSAEDVVTECQKFNVECQLDWFKLAEPTQKVNVDAFWIDQTEVTNKMYAMCVEAGSCEEPASKNNWDNFTDYYGVPEFENHPVVNIRWIMAKAYCESVGRRLPTEAEWEKSARGTDERYFPWGNDEPNPNLMNYIDSSSVGQAKVGTYPNGASPYGALDMAGNVAEWIDDMLDIYPGGDPNEITELQKTYRVIRGGSFFANADESMTIRRFGQDPTFYAATLGFRCAQSASQ